MQMSKFSNLASKYAAGWTSRDAFAVAGQFEPTGELIVNGKVASDPKMIADVAEGFFTLLPDLHYMADDVRIADKYTMQSWTLYGHHSDTKKFMRLSGWTTWNVSARGKIQTAQMFFDPSELA